MNILTFWSDVATQTSYIEFQHEGEEFTSTQTTSCPVDKEDELAIADVIRDEKYPEYRERYDYLGDVYRGR
jgi:hypothetical protein